MRTGGSIDRLQHLGKNPAMVGTESMDFSITSGLGIA
jgi:hypothetical protein